MAPSLTIQESSSPMAMRSESQEDGEKELSSHSDKSDHVDKGGETSFRSILPVKLFGDEFSVTKHSAAEFQKASRCTCIYVRSNWNEGKGRSEYTG